MSIMSNAKRALAVVAAAATLFSMAACGSSNADSSAKSDSSSAAASSGKIEVVAPSTSGVPWPRTSAAATSKSPTS